MQTKRQGIAWGAALAGLVLVLALPALSSAAGAAPVAPTGSSGGTGTQWAYGGSTWANTTVTFPNGTLSVTSFFGWHSVWTETNTSSSIHELELVRTSAARVDAQFCSPSCGAPTVLGNLTVNGWERDVGFVNLTDQASVQVNGSSVAAFGLLNESVRTNSNLTEQLRWNVSGPQGSRGSAAYLTVAADGRAAIAFSPALGVVPANVTPGTTWTSTANFTAVGNWSANALASHRSAVGLSGMVRFDPAGSVNRSGSVQLRGADLGNLTLRNGESTQVIVLGLEGPFEIHEGLLLVPGDSDLFAVGDHHAWDSSALGLAGFATDRVDVRLVHGGFPRLDAAASDYSAGASSIEPAQPPVRVGVAASPTGPSGLLQAQPESPQSAEQGSSCLLGNCPAAGPAPGAWGGSAAVAIILVAVLAGLVVGTVGVIEYRRWAARMVRSRSLVGPSRADTLGPVLPGATLTAPVRGGGGAPSAPPASEPHSGPGAPR